jgi:hypothetical protein
MNYSKIYENLIKKAKYRRSIEGYSESHHIIPKCLGGTNESENLIELTPEEHYIAHQLLAKIHPNDIRLLHAAVMMCVGRPSNKLYGWLKRRLSIAQSLRMQNDANPTKDMRWISNEYETVLVDKNIAKEKIFLGTHISGKIAKRLSCGHLVISRCIPCDDLKNLSYEKKKENAKLMAHELFNEFKNSDCKSVCEFAKLKGTSQPRLSILWKKYVDEYNQVRQQGKSFLKE